MVLGLSLPAFTLLHVAISLIAIAMGIVFFAALGRGRWLGTLGSLFILFTVLTSVTGFFFPPKPIGPPFIFAVVSLVLLAIAHYANTVARVRGFWWQVFIVTALAAQWLNMVVLVVQSYQKIPALHRIAPTGSEPAVLLTQGAVLLVILFFGWTSFRKPGAVPAR
ncbi:hypothetical protein [Sphingomonas immobilis]|uniref:DUF2306 domain-containing protein n=1 Tax=Sphingomonas immobilis TaxID=3063997 RepID=A0ABT8ZVP4_9SPHN|nr:hypothetical protein [Sphingomonas sp. CA1-15]MDO7841636.1 hypothetical protein [Sphingomonas sp. CA1-15]